MHYPMIDTHQINFFCIFHFYFAVFVKLSKPKGLEIGKKLGQISHSVEGNISLSSFKNPCSRKEVPKWQVLKISHHGTKILATCSKIANLALFSTA